MSSQRFMTELDSPETHIWDKISVETEMMSRSRFYISYINVWYICTLKLIQLFKSFHPQRVQMKI